MTISLTNLKKLQYLFKNSLKVRFESYFSLTDSLEQNKIIIYGDSLYDLLRERFQEEKEMTLTDLISKYVNYETAEIVGQLL